MAPSVGTCGRALSRARYRWSDSTPGSGAPSRPLGLIFADDEDVAPDLVWMSHDRRTGAWDERAISTRPGAGHRSALAGTCQRAEGPGSEAGPVQRQGVHEYWIVDRRAQTVDVYRPTSGGLAPATQLTRQDTLTSPVLPGFTCVIGTLFAGEVHT